MYSKSFYFKSKGEGDAFSRIPKGKLIVNRVLRNQAPFKQAHVISQPKPKSLVIADWTLKNLEDWEIERVIESIKQLMENDFPVYLWQDGRIIALNKTNITCLKKKEIRELITPAIQSKVIAATPVEHDKVKILDKYWLNSLLKTPVSLTSQQLLVSDLETSDINTVLATFRQAIPPFDAVIIDLDLDSLPESLNINNLLLVLSKELPIYTQYSQLKLDREKLNKLLREGSLTINNKIVSISELNNLEKLTIDFEGELKAEELTTLLGYFPKLKSLSLKKLSLSTGFENLPEFKTIEALSIESITTSVANLESLLISASALKSLTLQQVKLTDIQSFTKNLHLDHLDHLKIETFNYSSDYRLQPTHLQDIFQQSSSLKTLELNHFPLANIIDTPFSSLRELTLTSKKVDLRDLLTFSLRAPAIEILDIEEVALNNSILIEEGIYFSNLKELDANNSNINIASLEKILKHARNLESLDLTACARLGDDEAILTLNFEHLKTLHLIDSNITEKNIAFILAQAKNLETLSLGKNDNLRVSLPAEVKFIQLKELEINSQTITSSDDCLTYALLKKAEGLTVLQLSFATFEDNVTQDLNLTKLKKFVAQNTKISGASLNFLLKKTNVLEYLDLTSDSLDEENEFIDFTDKVNFSHVKYLSLSHNKINTSSLEAIFKQAAELQILDLSDCKGIFPTFKNTQDFQLAKLEELNLTSSDISLHNLKAIIKAAPNLKKIDIGDCPKLLIDDELRELLRERNLLHILEKVEESNSQQVRKLQKQSNHKATSDKMVKSHSVDDSATMDADTKLDPSRKYNLKQTLFPLDPDIPVPSVRMYRKQVFNDFRVNPKSCTPEEAFSLHNVGDPLLVQPTNLEQISSVAEIIDKGRTLVAEEKAKQSGTTYYFGHQDLVLSPNGVALDSWVAHELLTHYHIDPPVPGVELIYSKRDNLYYLYGPKDKTVKISFLLKIEPQPKLPADQVSYYEKMKEFFNKKFTDGELKFEKTNPTGKDYLESIINQKKGACRHRTLAFQTIMNRLHKAQVPTRYVGNPCHAFAEAFVSNQWIKLDLGGYPAELNIDDSNNPDNLIESESASKPVAMEAANMTAAYTKYARYLATWKKSKPEISSVKRYCQHLTTPEKKKTLVEFSDSDEINALQISLQDYCKHTSSPCFYINSPDDLVCSAPFIKRKGEFGVLQKGPGGPLYDFLEAYRTSKTPIYLIVNYDNFDANDIVNLNALIDKAPHADGTPLPDNTQVIGLINTKKPDCYQGQDFYSRFDAVEACPITSDILLDQLNQLAPLPTIDHAAEITSETTLIDLYHAADWKERLLGYWAIKGDKLIFIEGELSTALKKAMPIEIKNGLWNDFEFRHFWQQALALGYILHEGEQILLPKDLQLKVSEGYNWADLLTNVQISSRLNTQAQVLNPGQFSTFLNQYICQNKQLINIPGLIEKYDGQALEVLLTHELTEDEWALFLAACQKHKVRLTVDVAPGVNLPVALNRPDFIKVTQEIQTWQGNSNDSIIPIVSDDIGATIHQLSLKNKGYRVIDVSECEPNDLLTHIHGEFNNEQGLVFQSYKRALLTAIDEGTPVILKGHFSQDLIDALAPILLSNLNKLKSGQLVLVSDKNSFSYLPITQVHNVSPMDKWSLLYSLFPQEIDKLKEENLFSQESFTKLYSRLLYLRHHPNETNSQLNWAGLHGISGGVKLKGFDEANSAAIAEEFDRQRLAAVNEVLAYSPYVFLTGLTAVGKSTFVEKQFKNKNNVTLYQGLDNLLNWAMDDKPDQQKILFIDEANLLPSEFSVFKGLFNNPPTILIDGIIHPLSPNHKVIFAGNPLNYGDERHLASLFAEHGRAVVFEPMPQEYIYENILRPVFVGSKLNNEHILQISREFLNVYRFLCECSADKVLISPREVQMMALFVTSYLQEHPNLSLSELNDIAKFYSYKVAVDNVPVENRLTFDTQFKPDVTIIERDTTTVAVTKDFLLTPSRRPMWQQLQDLLALRTYKQQGIEDAQKYGGLGGLILEGEPGTGKSELVIAALLSQGYQKVSIYDTTVPLSDNIFYHIPVSLSLEEKKACLLKAFNEGAVVVIDEINSSPMMERLINDLLMGYNDKKERPTKPGFLIIGTQNPVTMAGRRHPSEALARRLMKAILPAYSNTEMEAILQAKGLERQQAIELVEVYQAQVNKAAKENLTPAPTFRDLQRLAEDIIIGQNKKLQNIEPMQVVEEDKTLIEEQQAKQNRKRKTMTPAGFFNTKQERHNQSPISMEESSKREIEVVSEDTDQDQLPLPMEKESKREIEVGNEIEEKILTEASYLHKERFLEERRSMFDRNFSKQLAKKARREEDNSTGMDLIK
ncbi:AAA family ATPase [Legionella gresilensis]|uniref:AAA family ATPase n=1 Tax=Legionella gresilensis TaxID=91823 RepID=UPI0013EFB2D5|nr:AAA family ATPase [Legionella gresilensis]